MVLLGPRTDHQNTIGIECGHERRRNRPRTDPFHQGRHRGGVAQARAVIDIIGAEPLPHQLLEQIGLLVRALGRAEAGQRGAAMRIADMGQPASGAAHRLLPCRLAEHRPRVHRINRDIAVFGGIVATDQGLGQTVRMAHIIKTEPAFDAEAVFIGGTIATIDTDDGVILDRHFGQTADPAIGADRIHLFVGYHHCLFGVVIHQ
jgi:hypothetical protein